MAEIVKFIYVIIIFFSLLLVSMEVDGCTGDIECKRKMWCPSPSKPMCLYPMCVCAIIKIIVK
ncbi:unnamed protein product [Trifolium pratense]|uniref:Uncharacterized protein n=1 Tax=Trifolium pratense TaxID=57577 RepID=A0ACB0J5T1_TRIPR|nr:unnamed protein product [Trifolium pratense]